MPYFHVDCGGEIGLWTRKCHKCKEVWPLRVLFAAGPPKDMIMIRPSRRVPDWMLRKGNTSYAKWADKAPPGVVGVASFLPNWPRWARLLSLVVFVLLVTATVLLIRK